MYLLLLLTVQRKCFVLLSAASGWPINGNCPIDVSVHPYCSPHGLLSSPVDGWRVACPIYVAQNVVQAKGEMSRICQQKYHNLIIFVNVQQLNHVAMAVVKVADKLSRQYISLSISESGMGDFVVSGIAQTHLCP